jgi:rhodanese-related sulfurtransferase
MSKRHRTSRKPKPSGASARGRRSQSLARPPWLWVGLGVAAVAVLLVLLLGPTDRGPTEITAAQAYGRYQRGAFFLDVREQEDWDAGHIPESVVIPLGELPARLDELPRDREIVVVCGLGVRSREGARILVEAGFSPVACLRDGLRAWEAAGYPVEQAVP